MEKTPKLILMEDMNAHTSNINDFICNDYVDDIPARMDYVLDDKLLQCISEELKRKACSNGKKSH